MVIGIDARFFFEAGGLGRYTSQLVRHLEKTDRQNDYLIFLNRDGWKNYQPANPRFKKIPADVRWYSWKEQIVIPWKIRRARPDLMFFPHWNAPLLSRKRFIVAVHDLILLKFPSQKATTLNRLFFRIKYWAYKKVLRRAVLNSRKIIVPSEFVKKDILANFKIPPEKIAVIYEGAGMEETRYRDSPDASGGEAISRSVRKKTRFAPSRDEIFKKPYFLYVGAAYPHKNLEGLVEAFKIFCEKYSKDYHLALVGKENHFYRRLQKQFNDLTIKPLIHYLGCASDEQLPDLYRRASLYVFPSFYEGFGLPGLEAMSRGLPVLASDSSCLPEIYGEAALYFDPTNPEEMAAMMQKGAADENLREKLKQKGYEQAKKYSWEKTAEKTLQIFQNSV